MFYKVGTRKHFYMLCVVKTLTPRFYKAVANTPGSGDGVDLSLTPDWKAASADMFKTPKTPSPFKNRRMTRRYLINIK